VNYSMYQLLGVLCSGPFPLKGASMYSRLWLEVARSEGGGALCSLEGDAMFLRGEEGKGCRATDPLIFRLWVRYSTEADC
jgi:hypothetical protein